MALGHEPGGLLGGLGTRRTPVESSGFLVPHAAITAPVGKVNLQHPHVGARSWARLEPGLLGWAGHVHAIGRAPLV